MERSRGEKISETFTVENAQKSSQTVMKNGVKAQ